MIGTVEFLRIKFACQMCKKEEKGRTGIYYEGCCFCVLNRIVEDTILLS